MGPSRVLTAGWRKPSSFHARRRQCQTHFVVPTVYRALACSCLASLYWKSVRSLFVGFFLDSLLLEAYTHPVTGRKIAGPGAEPGPVEIDEAAYQDAARMAKDVLIGLIGPLYSGLKRLAAVCAWFAKQLACVREAAVGGISVLWERIGFTAVVCGTARFWFRTCFLPMTLVSEALIQSASIVKSVVGALRF